MDPYLMMYICVGLVGEGGDEQVNAAKLQCELMRLDLFAARKEGVDCCSLAS
jgi:hypothetical protein